MKIPTSSSILLATLAISSSSSCLAAPTGADAQDTGMTSSPSFSTSSASAVYPTGMNAQERSETIVQRNAEFPVHLESRQDLRTAVVSIMNGLPIIGPVLTPLLSKILGQAGSAAKSLDVNSSGSGQSIDPQQVLALQNAVDEVRRMFNETMPSPAKNAPGTVTSALPVNPPVNPAANPPVNLPFGAMSNDDGSGSSSADPAGASNSASVPGPTESAASDGGSAPASGGDPSASAPPASPTLPGGPPNTPVNQ